MAIQNSQDFPTSLYKKSGGKTFHLQLDTIASRVGLSNGQTVEEAITDNRALAQSGVNLANSAHNYAAQVDGKVDVGLALANEKIAEAKIAAQNAQTSANNAHSEAIAADAKADQNLATASDALNAHKVNQNAHAEELANLVNPQKYMSIRNTGLVSQIPYPFLSAGFIQYVHPELGNDSNHGWGEDEPVKTFSRALLNLANFGNSNFYCGICFLPGDYENINNIQTSINLPYALHIFGKSTGFGDIQTTLMIPGKLSIGNNTYLYNLNINGNIYIHGGNSTIQNCKFNFSSGQRIELVDSSVAKFLDCEIIKTNAINAIFAPNQQALLSLNGRMKVITNQFCVGAYGCSCIWLSPNLTWDGSSVNTGIVIQNRATCLTNGLGQKTFNATYDNTSYDSNAVFI